MPKISTGKNPSGSIELKNVTKTFKIGSSGPKTYSTLKSTLIGLIKKGTVAPKVVSKENIRQKLILNDISFKVEPGTSYALVGRNGSGKSTILKLISGIYAPDSGQITVEGSVSALIELGAGFHPDFSGRENIMLGGIMFGLTKKQVEDRFDQIVEYSELEDVIDQPVRTYSSGMYMRLGFSLAIHTDPDILLVDEVLAVGDAHFIKKCHDSISEFRRRGKTLIFVTHDLSSVSRWCDKAVWLDKGHIRSIGTPKEIADAYLSDIADQENLTNKENIAKQELTRDQRSIIGNGNLDKKHRWGDNKIEITKVQLLDQTKEEKAVFFDNESLIIKVSFKFHTEVSDLVFGIGIIRADGLEIFGTNSSFIPEIDSAISNNIVSKNIEDLNKVRLIEIKIPRISLSEGSYFVDVAAHAHSGLPYDYHHQIYKFQVRTKDRSVGIISPNIEWNISNLNSGEQN